MMSDDKYYILSVDYTYGGREPMMLGSMPDLPEEDEDDWMFGQPFTVEPELPIFVDIREDEENLIPLNFYKDPPVATKAFVDALVEAGVDNIVTYDVVLRSRTDPSITVDGYKAINIIGWVKVAGPGTVYLTDSRIFDASMKNVELEPRSVKGLYMFRQIRLLSVIGDEYPCHFFQGNDFLIGGPRTDMLDDHPLAVSVTVHLDRARFSFSFDYPDM